MEEFNKFKEKLQKNFAELIKDATHLFEINIDKDEFWNLYLDSFPAGTNEIYRERREYDCNACKRFIRTIGNAVVIKDNKVHTIWDFDTESSTFQPVADALSSYLKERVVTDVYVSKYNFIGLDYNHEIIEEKIHRWDHLYLQLPDRLVDKTSRSEGEIKGVYRDTKNVFKRSLDEITEESVQIVLELISQGSLYRAEENKGVLENFLTYKKEYEGISDAEKDNYAWEKSLTAGMAVGRIRNHAIGTLLVDISNDVDLNEAVVRYRKIMDPTNYQRSMPVYTKRMLENAQKTVIELGYQNSLQRRFANIDDITVNNILFANRDSAKRMAGGDIFAEMAQEVSLNPRKFAKVEEVPVEKFISDILPHVRELEVLLENRHASNMVSMLAPVVKESPSMFKWNNAFGWAYAGNIADSELRNRVKDLGGRVDGALRFSHTWNYDPAKPNQSLMDLHVFMPNSGYESYGSAYVNKKEIHDIYPSGRRVGWNKRQDRLSGGIQDVDFTRIPGKDVPVENTVFPDIDRMPEGKYIFKIHNWRLRQPTRSGFKAEIECGGELYQFEYDKPLENKEWITVAEAILKDGMFTVDPKMPTTTTQKEIWGLKTNQFVPVSVVCYSPNYWDEQNGIGNKHYMFMLKDCVNPERPNGFYNEFLKPELKAHRRVFEALGAKTAVQDVEDQLSGLGFSSTKRNDILIKVKGATERVIRVKF